VFDNLRDGIHFGVERGGELVVSHLFDGPFRSLFVLAEEGERVREIRVGELMRHGGATKTRTGVV
jgi:hypothetical protein